MLGAPSSIPLTLSLSPAVRKGLLLLGLCSGAAVYLLFLLLPSGGSALQRGALVVGLALCVQVPLFVGMAVTDWRSPRLWAGAGVLALVIAATGGWAMAGVADTPRGHEGQWARLAVALSLWWLVALSWYQAWLEQGHWRIPYASLFVHAWNNTLVLALAALCAQLVWGVLWLWAGLFALLGVTWFAELFAQLWFATLCSGVLAGLGLWVARTQERPIQMARQTLLALGRLLLPMLAWVLVLFVGMLAFTGVQTLWATKFAAVLLMVVLVVHIWLVNAVFQDGRLPTGPYAIWVRHLVHASLLAMPVLAVLACWAVGLRVVQYGWTVQRVWSATGAALLALYALGYAWAGVRSLWPPAHPRAPEEARPWLAEVAPVNRALSLLLLVLLLALQTPVLDPQRISAASQLQRLASGALPLTQERLAGLKFDHGRYGAAAFDTLAQSPLAQAQPAQAWVQQVQAADSPLPHREAPAPSEEIDIPLAQARIAVPAGQAAPPQDWWPWLLAQAERHYWARDCVRADAGCSLVSGDWDRDGQQDQMLCSLHADSALQCQLTARNAQGQWQAEGRVSWPRRLRDAQEAQIREALRAGQVQPQVSRWPGWRVALPPGEAGEPSEALGRLEVPW